MALDIRIIKAAAKGKNNAERQLFEHFYPYVMSICLRYMKNESEAEECLNDSFLKILKNLRKFDVKKELKPWIRKITVNTCIDRIRQLKNNVLHLSMEVIGKEYISEDGFSLPETTKILPLIQELPPAYRAVFNLHVFEDYKHKEIAVLLNISEGTSKSNYARAKQWIRQHVSNDRNEMKKILIKKNGS